MTNGGVASTVLDNHAKYDIWCHQFSFLAQYLILTRGIVSPTLNVNSILRVIPCEFLGGLQIYSVAITVTY